MMRIHWLIVALVFCVAACSSPPPTSAPPTANDSALVDNTDTAAAPDNTAALPEHVTKGVGAFVDPGNDGKALEEYVAGLLKK